MKRGIIILPVLVGVGIAAGIGLFIGLFATGHAQQADACLESSLSVLWQPLRAEIAGILGGESFGAGESLDSLVESAGEKVVMCAGLAVTADIFSHITGIVDMDGGVIPVAHPELMRPRFVMWQAKRNADAGMP